MALAAETKREKLALIKEALAGHVAGPALM
jgi:hypothetical protein